MLTAEEKRSGLTQLVNKSNSDFLRHISNRVLKKVEESLSDFGVVVYFNAPSHLQGSSLKSALSPLLDELESLGYHVKLEDKAKMGQDHIHVIWGKSND